MKINTKRYGVLQKMGFFLSGFVCLWIYFLFAWCSTNQYLYGGIDGSLYRFTIARLLEWSFPSDQFVINPYQGFGSLFIPMNPWINPGYWVFHVFHANLVRFLASYTIFLAELYFSTVFLSRSLKVQIIPSVLAAQVLCIALFPPSNVFLGLFAQFVLNPGVAHIISLGNLFLGFLIRLGNCKKLINNFLIVWSLPIILIYSILNDPFWTAVLALSFILFLLPIFLSIDSRKEFYWKIGGILGTIFTLVILKIPSYYKGISGYPARQIFRQEIYGAAQILSYSSLPFQNSKTLIIALIICFFIGITCFCKIRKIKIFGFTALFHFSLMIAVSLIYLLADINWTYPLPAYIELSAFPIYFIIAVYGFTIALPKFLKNKKSGLLGNRKKLRLSTIVAALPVASLIFLFISGNGNFISATLMPTNDTQRHKTPLIDELITQIQLKPEMPFRGSVVSFFGSKGSPLAKAHGVPDDNYLMQNFVESYLTEKFGDPHRFSDLWHFEIPTFEEYSQWVSPQFYYLMSRILSEKGGYQGRNQAIVKKLNFNLLRLFGVRFILTDWELKNPQLKTRQEFYESEILQNTPSGWQMIDTADFNNDGETDILLHNSTTGENTVWFMKGTEYVNWAGLPSSKGWQMVDTADFNNDGETDILLQNSATGENTVWFMKGTEYVNWAGLPSSKGWQMVDTADFNNDGEADILLQNSATGENTVWFMKGTEYVNWAGLPSSKGWQMVDTADFNNDGEADILLHNSTTDENQVWFMKRLNKMSQKSLPRVFNWQIHKVGDFNNDSHPDIILSNSATGENRVWLMNGTEVKGIAIRLYEFRNPNLATFSPTEVTALDSATKIVARLAADSFDPTQEVIVNQEISGDLTPAKNGSMIYGKGNIHVQASSDGTSILLLPLQFSHCFTIHNSLESDPQARIIRANLAQTAIIFTKKLDVRLVFDWGLNRNTNCRIKDIDDVKKLQMKQDGWVKLPLHLHPYSLKKLFTHGQ